MNLPDKRYQIIYADPPWQYRDKSKNRGGAERHYSTMPYEEINALPVGDLALPDCALFMWCVWPHLFEIQSICNHWGFTYRTCAFVWAKTNKRQTDTWFWGMGHWTRSNTEFCILATRGEVKRASASILQVQAAPVEAHSRKPDLFRDLIVELMGDLPRIELFARERHAGWDCWGNEI